jgi:cystathionine beta-lyase
MNYNFDRIIDRRGTLSLKWQKYPDDVLPLWVADMDFAAPEPIITALNYKTKHGIFGYEVPSQQLAETVASRMQDLYGWQVSPGWVVATPGVVAGFNLAARSVCLPGQGIIIQPPVYPPFFDVHTNAGLVRMDAPLTKKIENNTLHYSIDFEAFEHTFQPGEVKTGMFLLCNPHNPTGQAYSRSELARLAEICMKYNVNICSDEIHSELLPGGAKHVPLASLDPEIGNHTITLIAPSKTFNIPGLFCGFAIIPDLDMRERFKKTIEGLAMHVSSLSLTAAQVAYSGECDDWLAALNIYLKGNRDFLVETVQKDFTGIRTTIPAATYLAWLDCNELVNSARISGTPHEFFLQQARVALNEGRYFGKEGEGFVRLNFGCPRKTLEEALQRMKAALNN